MPTIVQPIPVDRAWIGAPAGSAMVIEEIRKVKIPGLLSGIQE